MQMIIKCNKFKIALYLTGIGSATTNLGISYLFLLYSNDVKEYGFITIISLLFNVLVFNAIKTKIDTIKNFKFHLIFLQILGVFLTILIIMIKSKLLLYLIIGTSSINLSLYSLILYKISANKEKKQRMEFNKTLERVLSSSFLCSAIIAPVITKFFNVYYLFYLDIFTYFFTIFVFLKEDTKYFIVVVEEKIKKKSFINNFFLFFQLKSLKVFLFSILLANFYLSTYIFMLAILGKFIIGKNEFKYSILIIAMYSGRTIGTYMINNFNKKFNPNQLFLYSSLASGFIFLFMLYKTFYFIVFLEFLLGVFISFYRINLNNIIQETIPSKNIGRFYSDFNSMRVILKFLGTILIVQIVEKLNINYLLLLFSITIISSGSILYFIKKRPSKITC